MGFLSDLSSSIRGGSSGGSSIILPSISFPSISAPSVPSIPSYGSPPITGSLPLAGIDSIQSTINSFLTSIGAPPEVITTQMQGIAEVQGTQLGSFTQFQQDFNAQLTSLSTNLQQSLKPFWNKITDMGALMELLSNPETIIIIVAVIAAAAVGLYLAYKFYWSKIEFGEGVADKYTKRGMEAAKIFK